MKKQVITVLLIEDDPWAIQSVQKALKVTWGKQPIPQTFCLKVGKDLAAGLDYLQKNKVQLILFALSLKVPQNLVALAQLRHEAPGLPLLILVLPLEEALAKKALQTGVQDYLFKDQVAKSLACTVLWAVEKQHKKALRQKSQASEARFRAVINKNADAIVIVNKEGKIIFVNPAAETLLRAEKVALLGHDFGFPLVNGESTEIEILVAGLKVAVAEMRVAETEWESRPVYLASLRDITQRKQTEEQLKIYQNELEYQKLALDEHCIVSVTDSNGIITYVNARFCQISQYSAQELIGQNHSFLSSEHHSAAFFAEMWHTLAQGEVWHSEETGQRKDGSFYTVHATIVPFPDAAGNPYKYVTICTDITARKQTEELSRDRNRVLEMVAKNYPLTEVLAQITRLIEHQIQGMLCAVSLLTPEQLNFEADPSFPEGVTWNQMLKSPTRCWGRPTYADGSVLVRDLRSDSRCASCRNLAQAQGFNSCWGKPIFSGTGEPLGWLTGYYREAAGPKTVDLELLEGACNLAAIAIEQNRLISQLAHQANHDTLTGLPNRMLFEDQLRKTLIQAHKYEEKFAVLFIDLDCFKRINDTLGHKVGDILLQKVSQRLKSCIQPNDTLARMGGDEFTIVLNNLENLNSAKRVAQKILDVLNRPFAIEGHDLFITASIGISLYPDDGQDTITLESNADSAMYRAKSKGRHGFQCFTPEMALASIDSLRMETQLRWALERNEFLLHYQPQVDLSGKLLGAEALLRWNNPIFGMVGPDKFIPLAEESGLIVPIGNWVLEEACRQNELWRRAGHPAFRVAVNVSAVQFVQPNFVEVVTRILKQTQLEPCWLELELTESMLMRDYQFVILQLSKLRALGVAIAIDDFGTGYSSLRYLQRLPIDTLKIDHSFVHNIGVGSFAAPNDAAIVRAITTLGHTLGMNVVAEGVETMKQLQFLRSIGCNGLQGYLFGMPLPAKAFEMLLRKSSHGHLLHLLCALKNPTPILETTV